MLIQLVGNLLKAKIAFAAEGVQKVIINPDGNLPRTAGAISKLVSRLQTIVSAAAGVVAVGIILYGGFLYFTAGGDEEKAKKAKQYLTYGLVGAFIVLAANVFIVAFIRILGGDVS